MSLKMTPKISLIREKLLKLRKLDNTFEVFGASTHEYRFNPYIPIGQLNLFEQKYKITLPQDYKAFISQIGNGGAGPYYGIYPLQSDLGGNNPKNKFDFLKYDFPHTEKWNFSDKIFQKIDDLVENEENEISNFFDLVYMKEYYSEELTNGSLYLADYGCALRYILIISGKEKGNVWFDQRADRKGINPVLDQDGNKVSFSDWYISWLDNSIRQLKKSNK